MRIAAPEEGKREVAMMILDSLKNILRKLFFETRAAGSEPDEKPERVQIKAAGLETRCINPDIGCPFEVS
jgi:hypothetical protein